jgi:hypothetical protein
MRRQPAMPRRPGRAIAWRYQTPSTTSRADQASTAVGKSSRTSVQLCTQSDSTPSYAMPFAAGIFSKLPPPP